MARRQDGGLSFACFRADPALASLQWPDDVLEQFLFDHGDNAAFVHDYGGIDLRDVTWRLETIPAAGCRPERPMPAVSRSTPRTRCTGSRFAAPRWVGIWKEHGTWLRPPILIARRLLDPSDSGLQVVEGRTRVGVLRGRLREGLHVASHHQAWVGQA